MNGLWDRMDVEGGTSDGLTQTLRHFDTPLTRLRDPPQRVAISKPLPLLRLPGTSPLGTPFGQL